jgi:hypothetical protein
MTANVINFPATGWKKTTTRNATTGHVFAMWDLVEADRRATILHANDGFYYWRVWRPIAHRRQTPRQRFHPLIKWTQAPTLRVAMTVAKAFIAAYPLHR